MPALIEVVIGDSLYSIEVSRLDGMDWSAIMADATPTSVEGAGLGYEPSVGGVLACKRHGRLLDGDGVPVEAPDWDAVFAALSGVDARGVASAWWALNMRDPNKRVVALKKAWAAGGKMSSS